jgi:hypothetical protein
VSNDTILAFGLFVSLISFVGAYIFFRIQLEQESSDFKEQKRHFIAESDPTKTKGAGQQSSTEASD